ncbi:Polyketide synthase protein [Teratosphaeria destructans]|uniref:Polyketide synthase protein n=1 Tax=Teratosphaeria destructans TaxID=418781 RepID=A0A9W7SJG4_9PEZI|nr:Polyketide synthase protein [Teratosphaeria destructans]
MRDTSAKEAIALVGSSCRLPGGAASPSKLWELFAEPRNVVQEIPPSRFNTKAFYHQDSQHHGSTNAKYAYLLEDDPRAFDREFFNISPKEVEAMDPQQRCLLEVVYEGLESAGYTMSQLRGSNTGVFVGAMSSDHQHVAMRGLDSLPQYHSTGSCMSVLANRISYVFDWRGASVFVDTACSSSLVALHQAIQALRNGELNMAVAAGSNLILGPEVFISHSKLNMLSPNGRSNMWDSRADGYTRGEGFVALFVKTLSQAIEDGDSIECIIRETGVNSDGRTPGLTMPSAAAQTRLIQETYLRCGLDPTEPKDRPQFFEAHGTGTPAGDPIEARAIHDAFFPSRTRRIDDTQQIYVGSIKTVVGHTEGTSGLAAVLKAALALQHAQIPANLNFRELNPNIRPCYDRLKIPTALMPWPVISQNQPRRISVNCFGIGGTNAHAIVESWDDGAPVAKDACGSQYAGLYVLSANSAQALSAQATELAKYLRRHHGTDCGRLSRTLLQKANLPYRAAFSATSIEQLVEKLETKALALSNSSRAPVIPDSLPLRILGVFTGQGAQWPSMGKELYHTSAVFRRTIDQLQRSLDLLDEGDRPDWSLIDELSSPASSSRVSIAAISQPLCTAVQIALVDVLYAAGIRFAAVVGHSSGEISAAYAAGYLSARDAIRVAYYRGFHSTLARGADGRRGKMMAVGMGLPQALALCDYVGRERLKVAASNSLTSCTLAGDDDVVETAKLRLDREGVFARILAVDTAYHSHHMLPCAGPYLESLRRCCISTLPGPRKCTWYSSVFGANGRSRTLDDAKGRQRLEGQYWVENLTGTVQFSQAIHRALTEESYPMDLAMEIGPHPALKGPCLEMIKSLTGVTLPYGSVLKRGESATESFTDGVGLIWASFLSSRPTVTFDSLCRAFASPAAEQPAILKDLPSYPWDHQNIIWRESRASRSFRLQQGLPQHELLGLPQIFGDGGQRQVHWRQLLKISELPWMRGHTIQGEILFPTTAYLTMAYEASVRLINDQQQICLIELHNVELMRAINLSEESAGVEMLFTISVTKESNTCVEAEMACYSGDVNVATLNDPPNPLTANFTGKVLIMLGSPQKKTLPSRARTRLPLDAMDVEQFYSYLAKVGYKYSGHFRAKSIERRLNHGVTTAPATPESESIKRAALHPSALDTSLQALLAAHSFPKDGRLQVMYLPTSIDCVRISLASNDTSGDLMADGFLTSADGKSLVGDVDVFNTADNAVNIQMRGVRFTALSQDRYHWSYAGEKWLRDAKYGVEPAVMTKLSPQKEKLRLLLVRTAYFFLRRLHSEIKTVELFAMSKHFQHMMTWVRDHLFPQIEAGALPEIQQEWTNDTFDDVQNWSCPYLAEGDNDMQMVHAVGQNLAAIARGMVPALQVMLKDGMLERLYTEGLGIAEANQDLAALVIQLAHRHPRMQILEVGAGTGGTTQAVLPALGELFASYTFTDISAGFFDQARTTFSKHADRFRFKKLDIEKDPTQQGFEESSFDLIIASNCIHATRCLQDSLKHCRRLLKPGGYLMLMEITQDHLPVQLLMGTLPGWFLGRDEGRVWAPTISLEEWSATLKTAGFSGVDASSSPSYCSVILSQAVDPTVDALREPLLQPDPWTALRITSRQVLVIGASKIASRAHELIAEYSAACVTRYDRLEDAEIPDGAIVLSLCDLDSPVFEHMTQQRFESLQALCWHAKTILFVTSGAASGVSPMCNIMVGLGRTLLTERGDLRLQILDAEVPTALDPSMLVAMLLRLSWKPSANESPEVLWTHEPHLSLRDDALYIPRILSLDDVNLQSRARSQEVTQSTSLVSPDIVTELIQLDGRLQLQSSRTYNAIQAAKLEVQVTASTLHAIVHHASQSELLYVCIGRHLASGDKVLGLSSRNSSIVTMPEDAIIHRWKGREATTLDDPQRDAPRLHDFLTWAQAKILINTLKAPIWIHEAPLDLSKAIADVAQEKAISIFQTTSLSSARGSQTFVHPYSNKRDLESVRPQTLATFVDLSPPRQDTGLSALLRACLPCPAAIVARSKVGLATMLDREQLSLAAPDYFTHTDGGMRDIESFATTLAISEISSSEPLLSEPRDAVVVDWSTTDEVLTTVRPLAYETLLGSDKTYVLFGMTGDLGISTALWMLDNGARYIVLASRNPNVSAEVADYVSHMGASLCIKAVDVTSREALEAAITDIESIMPPIGGVINGAMILRDQIFVDMCWSDFEAVLAPKILGTQNLDDIFRQHGNTLDFFVCLSSATSLVGNPGQSAYSAANHFMAGLMRQRRARGLAGSTLVIGFLTGLGYVFRRGKEHLAAIEKSLLPLLDRQSETDLHEMLAEAIVSGRPDSDRPTELITGIRKNVSASVLDPRLSSYFVDEGGRNGPSSSGQADENDSIAAQLSTAQDSNECQALLEKSFAQALGKMLQLPPTKIVSNVPVADLGMDSLQSVRVREWVLKHLGVEVSVLKIMSSNYSLSRLCEDVLVSWRKLRSHSCEAGISSGTKA